MKIFISHSTKNAWMLPEFLKLLYSLDQSMIRFCSSDETSLKPGDDWKKEIYKNLNDADVFIAIISKEYWESKYCIFELGAAYERHCNDREKRIIIIPALLPPLKKEQALVGTPLVEMQLADLTKYTDVEGVLRLCSDKDNESVIKGLNVGIGEFCTKIHESVLRKTSLYDAMNYGAYFDERGKLPVPRSRIVKCRRDDDKLEFTFNLSLLDYGENPSFASVALMFLNKTNLREFLSYDRDAALRVDVNNLNGVLNDFTVEFKHDEKVVSSYTSDLKPGENKVLIPLKNYNYDVMEDLDQICFVVHPTTMNSLDGEVIFSNIRVEFVTKNILDLKAEQ